MPIYDYKCEKCGETREVLVRMDSQDIQICDCGQEMVKQVSKSNFQFNCSGFYQTDYGRIGQQSGYKRVRQKAEETITKKERRKKHGWQYKNDFKTAK
jgi:putative FmdB family regulatory protein